MKNFRVEFIFLLLYIFLTIIFTYPLILKFNTSIYGYPSDAFETIWRFWWRANVGSLPELAEPYLLSFYGKWMTVVTNEIFAYNFLLFLSFPLSALAMYLLVFEITKHKYASFIPGLIYSFSLYRLWRGFSHLDLLQTQWLPFYVWSLLKLHRWRNTKWCVITALIYLGMFLTNYYYAYFMLLFTAAFVFGQLVLKKIDFKLVKCYLLVFVLIVFSTVLFVVRVSRSPLFSGTYRRPFDDLLALSARPWDYVLPSIYHPVYGKFVEPIYQAIKNLGNDFEYMSAFPPERMIYLGWTALVLATFGFVKGLGTRYRSVAILFGICLVLMLWTSGPAYISFDNFKIPFPSFFLYRLFPMARAYVRLGIVVLLCVSVLAGLGVKFLLERIKNKRLLFSAYCLVPFLVLFEVLNFPPFHSTDFSKISEVYQWLKEQPGDFIIAEYPRDNDTSFNCEKIAEPVIRNYSYGKFFQRIHGKRLFESDYLDNGIGEKLSDLTNPETSGILSSFGVKYVVVHTEEIFELENPLDSCHGLAIMPSPSDDVAGLKLVKEFPQAVVYEVSEK